MTDLRANRYRTAWAGDLRAGDVGGDVRVSGWVHRRRDHGGLIFIDLRDRSGLLQLVFHPEHAPDAHAKAKELRAEDALSAFGALVAREEQNVNPNMATGSAKCPSSAQRKNSPLSCDVPRRTHWQNCSRTAREQRDKKHPVTRSTANSPTRKSSPDGVNPSPRPTRSCTRVRNVVTENIDRAIHSGASAV